MKIFEMRKSGCVDSRSMKQLPLFRWEPSESALLAVGFFVGDEDDS